MLQRLISHRSGIESRRKLKNPLWQLGSDLNPLGLPRNPIHHHPQHVPLRRGDHVVRRRCDQNGAEVRSSATTPSSPPLAAERDRQQLQLALALRIRVRDEGRAVDVALHHHVVSSSVLRCYLKRHEVVAPVSHLVGPCYDYWLLIIKAAEEETTTMAMLSATEKPP